MLTSTLILIGFGVMMLLGIIFVALGLPGVSYIFIIAALYELIDKFQNLTGTELAILGGIAVFSIIIDQLAGILGGRFGGAKGKSFLYGIVGLIVGNILFPVLGGLIGLFAGIMLGEILRRRKNGPISTEDIEKSAKAGVGGVIGAIVGMGINMILAIASIVLFIVFVI